METKRKLDTLEILGTSLCLDFANTLNSRVQTSHDYLRSYADLLAWARRVGSLTAEQEARLLNLARQDARKASKTLRRAIDLRELIYRVFAEVASEHTPKKQSFAKVMDAYALAVGAADFVKNESSYSPQWEKPEFTTPLWPIAYAAGELLLSAELGKVKKCPGCGWLFVDRSKNQSRRWCNMDVCGARDKMRRYHRRLKSR